MLCWTKLAMFTWFWLCSISRIRHSLHEMKFDELAVWDPDGLGYNCLEDRADNLQYLGDIFMDSKKQNTFVPLERAIISTRSTSFPVSEHSPWQATIRNMSRSRKTIVLMATLNIIEGMRAIANNSSYRTRSIALRLVAPGTSTAGLPKYSWQRRYKPCTSHISSVASLFQLYA